MVTCLQLIRSLQCRKRVNVSASVLTRCEDGLTMVMSLLSDLLTVCECSTLLILRNFLTSIELQVARKKSFTLVFPPINKETILNDKLIFSSNDIPTTLLFRILVQVLTSNAKGCKPFWNDACAEKSRKLWLPIETVCVALASTSSNTSSRLQEEESSFWMKKTINPQNRSSLKTFSPSFTSLTADKWEDVATVKNKKIRIYPTAEQKTIIKQWFGTHRYVYNQFLNYTKSNNETKEWMNFYGMRNKFVLYNNGANDFFNDREWMIETPKDIRADAIKSCISAHKSAFTNLRNKNITNFNVNYKSKKRPSYSISIPHSAIKYEKGGFYLYKRYIKTPIKVHNRTLKKLGDISVNHDSKLMYDGLHYYLLVATDQTTKRYIGDEKRVIALDPGVRTFQTGYSDDEVIEFSSRTDKILKLHNKVDLLKSLRGKQRKKIKRKTILKINNKIRNIVNDVHWKTITYLRNNYTDVLLPSFDSQEMVANTPLHRTTKRRMLGLQHFTFKKRLQEKTDVKVHIVNESFTSKTCGRCGDINFGLCSSKTFRCCSCNLTIDRDFNGARNIYLKHMGGRPNTLNESK